jgi:trimeric autotransporter adhesin
MKRDKLPIIICSIFLALAVLCLVIGVAYAAPTAAPVPNGGTGTTTAPAYGQVLIGGKNGEYEFIASSTFGGSGGGGTGFSTTSANYWLTQQTTSGLAEGSNLYFTNARVDSEFVIQLAGTTSVKSITTLPSLSLPYTQLTGTPAIASSTLLGDTNTFSGHDTFLNTIGGSITGNAGTATALATNGTNCANGFYASGVDASGNAEGCAYLLSTTTPWSNGGLLAINASGLGYDISTTSLNASITGNAGTVTNGVYTTTFNGLFDNRLSATTSLPNITTLAGLSLPYSQLTGVPAFDTFAYPFPLGATSSLVTFTGGVILNNATNTITNYSAINGTTTNATSTNLSTTNASTTNLTVSGIHSALLLAGTTGAVSAYGGSANCTNQVVNGISTAGAGNCVTVTSTMVDSSIDTWGYPFPLGATSTLLTFTGGILVNSASSTVTNLTIVNSTTTNATTTSLEVGQLASTTKLVVSSLGSSGTNCVHANSIGQLSTIVGDCGSSAGITALGNYATTTGTAISLSTSTAVVNGVTYGTDIAVSTNGMLFTPTVTGSLANGGLAHSTIVVNGVTLTLGDAADTIQAASSTELGSDFNTFSKLVTLAGGASTTGEITAGTASSTNLVVSGIQSALIVTGSTGVTSAFGGSNCSAGNAPTGINANGTVNGCTTYLTGNQSITLSGDVSGSGATSITTTIGANAVTYAKFQTVAANSLVGNPTSATANAQAVATSTLFGTPTAGQILAFLNGANAYVSTTTLNIGGNAGTATALASAPSTCSAGQAPTGILASGNATGCTAYDTFGWPFTPLTANSVGTTSGLVINNASSTIVGNATTTGTFYAGVASSTSLYGAMLASCNSASSALTWNNGTFGCNTISGSGTVNSSSQGYNAFYNTTGAAVSGTSTLFLTQAGNIGIGGTTSPYALLTVGAAANNVINPFLFVVASSTSGTATTTLFSVSNTGGITLSESLPATSTTITLDWAHTPRQLNYQIGTAAVTITLVNATTSAQAGSTKLVWICNPGSVAGALTWAGVEWVGSAPTQTTTANQCDVYNFDVTQASSTPTSPAWKVAGMQGAGFQ